MGRRIARGEGGGDGAGVQAGDHGLRVAAGHLDRGGVDQLVQGGLGGAVGIPAAKGVVADGADTRRKGGEMGGAVAGQQAQGVFQDQRGADGVEGELLGERLRVQRLEGFFRAVAADFKRAGGDDDGVEGGGEWGEGGGDAGFIRQVKPVGGAGQAGDLMAACGEGGAEGGTDAAGCAEDEGVQLTTPTFRLGVKVGGRAAGSIRGRENGAHKAGKAVLRVAFCTFLFVLPAYSPAP